MQVLNLFIGLFLGVVLITARCLFIIFYNKKKSKESAKDLVYYKIVELIFHAIQSTYYLTIFFIFSIDEADLKTDIGRVINLPSFQLITFAFLATLLTNISNFSFKLKEINKDTNAETRKNTLKLFLETQSLEGNKIFRVIRGLAYLFQLIPVLSSKYTRDLIRRGFALSPLSLNGALLTPVLVVEAYYSLDSLLKAIFLQKELNKDKLEDKRAIDDYGSYGVELLMGFCYSLLVYAGFLLLSRFVDRSDPDITKLKFPQ